jgi:hypothetical protein
VENQWQFETACDSPPIGGGCGGQWNAWNRNNLVLSSLLNWTAKQSGEQDSFAFPQSTFKKMNFKRLSSLYAHHHQLVQYNRKENVRD